MCINEDDDTKTNCRTEICADSGRKTIVDIRNPVDSILDGLCQTTAEFIRMNDPHKLITPNMITTAGLIMGLIALAMIISKKYLLAFVFFWLYYFLDCLDGYYARRYDMVTQVGDYYDHFRDIFITTSACFLIYYHLQTPREKTIFLIIIIVMVVAMLTHFGCQELYSSIQENNDCLALLSSLIHHKEYIKFTKYFGSGTFILVVSLFILYLNSANSNIN